MADFFVLLNDGSSYVLLNDGSSKVLLNVGQEPVVPPKTSISHTTLDAGVDLRDDRRKIRSRAKQELQLEVEIETRARFIKTITENIRTTKTLFEDLEKQIMTRAKFVHLLDFTAKTRFHKFKTALVEASIPTTARFTYDKIINTFKAFLEMEDEDDA